MPLTHHHGELYGHGTPMRRLLESGACRGDRFLQIGLRGYWPEPETLRWMAQQRMRSFEMTEVVARGLDEVLTEASRIALDDCDTAIRPKAVTAVPIRRVGSGADGRIATPGGRCGPVGSGQERR
ncbi:arginase family protein [Saccharopolyspora sp. K220]|uniref:arginase family protein n=1 Tax=Saccharopolyspora soli TaxID=2926618 RepID=UPI001F573353|nr:arginase family protein [Saccharopolyspora soli]MCI2419175.1 arginase family protein [Saccharopolyspora soli]